MAAISFEFLFKPVEEVDSWLTGLFSGAPLIVALGSPCCSASGTPRIPTTSSRSHRSSRPTAETRAARLASAPGGASATRRCCS